MQAKLVRSILLPTLLLTLIGCGDTAQEDGSSPVEQIVNELFDLDLDGDGIADNLDDDPDGDQLSNRMELTIGTNPFMADTDGDSFDDYYEYLNNRDLDPTKAFHALIPDVPDLRIEFDGAPHLYMITSEDTSVSESLTTTHGQTLDRSTAISSSSSNSFSNEINVGARLWAQTDTEVGGLTLFGFSAVVGAEASVSYTHSTDETYTWGQEDTKNVGTQYENAVTRAKDSGYTLSGAVLEIPIRVYNPSPISYKVTNLLMNASKIDFGGTFSEGKQMTFADEQGIGSGFILAPNSSSGLLTYKVTIDSAEEAKRYIETSTGVTATLSGYDMSYTDAGTGIVHDFTGVLTAVESRSARIMIDPGPNITIGGRNKMIDKRLVALPRFNPHYTSADDLYVDLTLGDALKALGVDYKMGQWLVDTTNTTQNYAEALMSFGYSFNDLESWAVDNNVTLPGDLSAETNVTIDTNTTLADFCAAQGGCSLTLGAAPAGKEWRTGIVELDGIAQDLDKRAYWMVALTKTSGFTYYFGAPKGSYDPAKITINPSDTVALIFSEDVDGDGVTTRIEIQNNSSDAMVDTDGDGLNDNLEFYGWCRGGANGTPVVAEYDVDGKPINECADLTIYNYTRADNSDTDGDDIGDNALNDYNDPYPTERSRNETAGIANITLQHNYGRSDAAIAFNKSVTTTTYGIYRADAAYRGITWNVAYNKLNWSVETQLTAAAVVLVDPISGIQTALTQDAVNPKIYASAQPVTINLGKQQNWTVKVLTESEAAICGGYPNASCQYETNTVRLDSAPGYFESSASYTENIRFAQALNDTGTAMNVTAKLETAEDPRIGGTLVAICPSDAAIDTISLENITNITTLGNALIAKGCIYKSAAVTMAGGTIDGLALTKRGYTYKTRTYTYGRFSTNPYVFSYITRDIKAADPARMAFTIKLTRVYNYLLGGAANWSLYENSFRYSFAIGTGTSTNRTEVLSDSWSKQLGGNNKYYTTKTYTATVSDLSGTIFNMRNGNTTTGYNLADAGVAFGDWMPLGTGWDPATTNLSWSESKTGAQIIDTDDAYKSVDPKAYSFNLSRYQKVGSDNYTAGLTVHYTVEWVSLPPAY